MTRTSGGHVNYSVPSLTTPQEWRNYLSHYSEQHLCTAGEHELAALTAEQRVMRWLGYEAAAEEEVSAAEQRLGVDLPPSFRSFLLTSDGWDGIGGWVERVLPSARLSWMRHTEGGRRLIGGTGATSRDQALLRLLKSSLKVAGAENIWLLDPTDTDSDGEWAAYLFDQEHGGREKFPSFAHLFYANRLV
ncbi:SMI1/KNR4 family protein [Streptomyces galbus]|uniref:SMI1/KNR4 family protein n=1 Tax=Streptomyces galbus TaxID=33898 RepID=UPI00380BBB3B